MRSSTTSHSVTQCLVGRPEESGLGFKSHGKPSVSFKEDFPIRLGLLDAFWQQRSKGAAGERRFRGDDGRRAAVGVGGVGVPDTCVLSRGGCSTASGGGEVQPVTCV